jgi:hypothetical protein
MAVSVMRREPNAPPNRRSNKASWLERRRLAPTHTSFMSLSFVHQMTASACYQDASSKICRSCPLSLASCELGAPDLTPPPGTSYPGPTVALPDRDIPGHIQRMYACPGGLLAAYNAQAWIGLDDRSTQPHTNHTNGRCRQTHSTRGGLARAAHGE